MRMIAFAGAAWLLCTTAATTTSAWAGLADAAGASLQASAGLSASPATDKVYPPLPTLSMLPPASSDDDDAPAPHTASRKKKLHAHDGRPVGPTARLVVSDASRTYLKDIEHQLDVALAR